MCLLIRCDWIIHWVGKRARERFIRYTCIFKYGVNWKTNEGTMDGKRQNENTQAKSKFTRRDYSSLALCVFFLLAVHTHTHPRDRMDDACAKYHLRISICARVNQMCNKLTRWQFTHSDTIKSYLTAMIMANNTHTHTHTKWNLKPWNRWWNCIDNANKIMYRNKCPKRGKWAKKISQQRINLCYKRH